MVRVVIHSLNYVLHVLNYGKRTLAFVTSLKFWVRDRPPFRKTLQKYDIETGELLILVKMEGPQHNYRAQRSCA